MDQTPEQILKSAEERVNKEYEIILENARLSRLARLQRYSGWSYVLDAKCPQLTEGNGTIGLVYDNVTFLQHETGRQVSVNPKAWANMLTEERISYCAALTRQLTAA